MKIKNKNLVKMVFYISFILIILNLFGFLSSSNILLTNNLYGNLDPIDNIILINIDKNSLSKLNNNLSNKYFLEIINKLNKSTIGFNLVFNNYYDSNFIKTINTNKNVIFVENYVNFKNKNNLIFGYTNNKTLDNLTKGYSNILIDNDRFVRSVNLNIIGNLNSFSNEIYSKHYSHDFIYSKNRFLINYIDNSKNFKSYSFVDVLNNEINLTNFENKIVIIGFSNSNYNNFFLTPNSKGIGISGNQIQANILQTMILENNLEKKSQFFLLFEIIFFSFITAYLANNIKIKYSFFSVLILISTYYLSVIIYFDKNLILNLLYIPLSILITYFMTLILLFRNTQKSKIVMNSAFKKYLSKDLIDEMVNDPSKIKIGGSKKKISILFSDIENFTTISENLEPEKLILFLNDYLEEMTKIIILNGGYVDKYIGDAIMAFWDSSDDYDNKTELSINSALQMLDRVDFLKSKWKNLYGEEINIRIGINYGEVIVGNIGSEEKFDYTAIGDNVNLASRLESINKNYKTRLIVSEFVYTEIKNKFICREIDYVRVKGKTKPIKIFEIIPKKNLTPLKREMLNLFHEGLLLYRNKDFNRALLYFNKAYSKYGDIVSKVFIDRCEFLKNKKLDENWDGIFTMKTK